MEPAAAQAAMGKHPDNQLAIIVLIVVVVPMPMPMPMPMPRNKDHAINFGGRYIDRTT